MYSNVIQYQIQTILTHASPELDTNGQSEMSLAETRTLCGNTSSYRIINCVTLCNFTAKYKQKGLTLQTSDPARVLNHQPRKQK